MTQEELDILTVKMLTQPEQLTDAEIEAIVGDEELRGIYDAAVKTKMASVRPEEVDVDAAWREFSDKHIGVAERKPVPWFRQRFTRFAAAIVVGVAVVSAFMFSHGLIEISQSGYTALVDTIKGVSGAGEHEKLAQVDLPDTLMEAVKDTIINKKPVKRVRPRVSAVPKRNLANADVTIDKQQIPVSDATQLADNDKGVEIDPEMALQIARQQARIENQMAIYRAEQYRSMYKSACRSYGRDPAHRPVQTNMYNENSSGQSGFMKVVMQ